MNHVRRVITITKLVAKYELTTDEIETMCGIKTYTELEDWMRGNLPLSNTGVLEIVMAIADYDWSTK